MPLKVEPFSWILLFDPILCLYYLIPYVKVNYPFP